MKSPEAFEFHSKPVAKSVYNTPKYVPKIKKQVSNATLQLRHQKGSNETKKQQTAKDHAVKLTKTQPIPSSFEQHDKEVLENIMECINKAEKRQEEYDKQQRAEIHKQAEHKANPVRHYKEVEIVPSQKVTIAIIKKLKSCHRRRSQYF